MSEELEIKNNKAFQKSIDEFKIDCEDKAFNIEKIKTIYNAFECFKKIFLKNKDSIFSDSKNILTAENIQILIANFLNKPDESSDKDFNEKIKEQLGTSKQVHELFAHVIWLWSIFASDMNAEGKVKDINNWLEEHNKIGTNHKFIFNHGIGSTGQYHKTNKPLELAYIIKLLEIIIHEPNKNYVEIIRNGVSDSSEAQKMKTPTSEKKVAMYNILLHLFSPTKYERMASYTHKEKIINFFESQFDNLDYLGSDDLDDKISVIRKACESDDKYMNFVLDNDIYVNDSTPLKRFDFYNLTLEDLWKNDIVLESKNMILHGAPGTGKTYSVENSIKNRLSFLNTQNDDEQFILVQFHPSYSYEDFIDGIKPSGISKDGNMKFELVNGEFKDICIRAFKELEVNKNTPEKAKKFYFIADEINRAELSRVFGELLLALEEDKRLRFVNGKLIGTKVKTQNSKLWTDKHAVVKENGNFYFGVPENLYFIGTMNDIDRSVDSFDMALRRRFFWKHYKCDYDVIYNKFHNNKDIGKYLQICQNLNNHITSSKGFNLGDSYELGHSYFMKVPNINNTQIEKIWTNNIAPLLKEYLRAEYSENDIGKHIEIAKKIFTIK